MSSTVLLTTLSTTPLPPPPQVFAGANRVAVVIWYTIICLFSITGHMVFIVGIKRLCGWRSDFSFTLLLIISVMSLLRFVVHLVASLTALFYMDWNRFQWLWIFLGSLTIAPYFTIVLLNLVISLHRLLYTAFPLRAGLYMSKTTAKITILVVGATFIFIVAIFNTELLGVRWIDAFMDFMAMSSRNVEIFYIVNKMTNYLVGIVNFAIYTILLLILVKRKMLSFHRNHEIKMTLQVLCMMIGEMLFFLFWELRDANFNPWELIISQTSNLLFYDILILPYLIFNGKIHAELRHAIYKRNGGSVESVARSCQFSRAGASNVFSRPCHDQGHSNSRFVLSII
ncbi:hypothetical protein V3C99_013982 [Haemonchus contortus]